MRCYIQLYLIQINSTIINVASGNSDKIWYLSSKVDSHFGETSQTDVLILQFRDHSHSNTRFSVPLIQLSQMSPGYPLPFILLTVPE